jgi:hypothetical protein
MDVKLGKTIGLMLIIAFAKIAILLAETKVIDLTTEEPSDNSSDS